MADLKDVRALVGGEWLGAPNTFMATSPSSGEAIARVAECDDGLADRAVVAAATAASTWAAMAPAERAALLQKAADAIVSRRDELSRLLTADQGKPLAEAVDEVDELVSYFTMAAADATRLEGSLPSSISPERRVMVARVPLGVVGIVTPWNWPYTMGAELFAPALAAGNTVVWVPAPTTSTCSGALVEVIAGSGLPAGVFNFVPGQGAVVGAAVVSHPLVSGVGFIGSVATGRLVAHGAAGKSLILELGGNGPMVVLADADLELAAEAALEAAYLCAGQSCTAGERFLVEEAVVAPFLEHVVALTEERVRLGDPFEPTTTMGPLNNEATADKFDRHVGDAVSRGARVLCGGHRRAGFPTSLFAEATVLEGVTPEMEVAREETFGPVVPVVSVRSAEEALELTNSSPFGLTAAVFTGDLERGLAFAERARAGWVNVNSSTNLWESHLPFGGRSGSVSGRGRVGGRYVLDAFTEPKTVLFPAPRRLLP